MRISDWSSDVCSSDLSRESGNLALLRAFGLLCEPENPAQTHEDARGTGRIRGIPAFAGMTNGKIQTPAILRRTRGRRSCRPVRSEEHTSELQSLMRISYAVFCLKTKKTSKPNTRMHQ